MTKRVSVRLDDDALRALRRLEAAGLSRSDALRKALVDTAARRRDRRALRAEVQQLEVDEEDRRETTQVADLMEPCVRRGDIDRLRFLPCGHEQRGASSGVIGQARRTPSWGTSGVIAERIAAR